MITLYLDTSDLSYLAKGRLPGRLDASRVTNRLLALLADDRVRLVVSPVHLAEIALDRETTEAAIDWLRRGTPVWRCRNDADAIFRDELSGMRPRLSFERLTLADLFSLRFPIRGLNLDVRPRHIAAAVKHILNLFASAETSSKRADRGLPGIRAAQRRKTLASQRHVVGRILSDDQEQDPPWLRWCGRAYRHVASTLLRNHGLTLQDLNRANALPPGHAWLIPIVTPSDWSISVERISHSQDAPASALRTEVERWEGDNLNRPARASTSYDVNHLAYVAYCDFGTLDGANFRATKQTRTQLARPIVFQTGKLEQLLERLERDAHTVP